MTTRYKAAVDATRSGSREYDAHQEKQVLQSILARVGPQMAVTTATLSHLLGIDGRTIRQILSDHDGVDFLLGGGDEGLYTCSCVEEGQGMTTRFENTAASTLERVTRRRAYAEQHLERRQAGLFD